MSEATATGALWSDRLADAIEARVPSGRIVCASGISPSGSIHMGNLREVFTTHLVAEALRLRGRDVVHLHSWDDYDRLRKVPAGVDETYARHIGMPLARIGDPFGGPGTWAEHFMDEFLAALTELGIEMHQERQSVKYPRGDYNAQIRRAMDERERIFDTLAEQQTAGRHDRPLEERRLEYFPFKPYCEVCGRDDTQVVAYADATAVYTCRHGHEGEMSLADGMPISGKLVWKVDWPMRWAYENVTFEPAGEDHHAPSGSFTVGRTIVDEIYGGRAPESAVYSFVSLAGMGGKMSGSAGGAAIASTALQVIEPAIVRWLYIRRLPNQSFAIDLTPRSVQKLYDEWDRFAAGATGPDADPADVAMHRLAVQTSAGHVDTTPRPVSFRLLASVADLTQANREQIGRIVAAHLGEDVPLEQMEPRLSCAIRYATELVPAEERTVVRGEFAADAYGALDAATRDGVASLAARLEDDWTLDGLTKLVYGVPKRMLGLEPDAGPSPELKVAQREFFKALYRLLVSAETGPRLPTLLLSIGAERARSLLVP